MKVHPKIVDRIVEAIKASETICVVGHVRPDGDCIGSQLGLTLALINAGKNVTCWNQDTLPAKLAFLDPKKLIQTPEKGRQFDCVIATDCASLERLGTTAECTAVVWPRPDLPGSVERYESVNGIIHSWD
jgi:phosphoesterase RecJ-like protein